MQFHSDEARWFLISLTSGVDYCNAFLIATWGSIDVAIVVRGSREGTPKDKLYSTVGFSCTDSLKRPRVLVAAAYQHVNHMLAL